LEKGSHRDDFERTALPHLDNLYGAAMRYTRDPAMAEDLVQDTVVRAFRFWHSFKPGTSIRAWLFTILRNTFINGYHRQNKRSSFKRRVREEMTSSGASMALGGLRTERREIDADLDMQSTRAHIDAALETLPDDYRVAVTLADIDGMSYKEIAEVMDCPIGTVMSRIYRGRKRLHALLFDHASELGYVDANRDPNVRPSTRKQADGDKTPPLTIAEQSDSAIRLDDYREKRGAL
jgi:RNA polymerase sigma-70 factor (ECF subfamily)